MKSKSRQKISIKQQIQNNAIALVSIVIAITSLAYNTWRNEQTEFNRNVRTSSFQILMSLAELQLLVDNAFYNEDKSDNVPIKGWRHVLYIQDLAQTVNPTVKDNADNLHQVWTEHWQFMTVQENSNKQINQSIKINRQHVISTLKALK